MDREFSLFYYVCRLDSLIKNKIKDVMTAYTNLGAQVAARKWGRRGARQEVAQRADRAEGTAAGSAGGTAAARAQGSAPAQPEAAAARARARHPLSAGPARQHSLQSAAY